MFGQRLRNLRTLKKLSQNDLANALNKKYDRNISKSMISRWENSKTDPRMEYVRIIADFFKVNPSDLVDEYITSEGFVLFNNDKTDDIVEIVKIPVLGTIACGNPITAVENVDQYLEEPSNNLPSGSLFYLKAKGNSMEPTIPNGSNVLIREQPEVEDNEIAAVLVNNDTEATLKRLKHQGNIVLLIPDNKEYDPIIITEANPARILGKAIRFTTDL